MSAFAPLVAPNKRVRRTARYICVVEHVCVVEQGVAIFSPLNQSDSAVLLGYMLRVVLQRECSVWILPLASHAVLRIVGAREVGINTIGPRAGPQHDLRGRAGYS